MIKIVICVLLSLSTSQLIAQEKVDWTYVYNPVSKTIEAKAVIAEGWHLYSQHIANEIGPIPTSFEFQDNPKVKFVGETVEPESIKEYDPNFESQINFFKDEVTFVQKVKFEEPTEVVGMVRYMVCNDERCMPPVDELFRISIH